MGEPNEPSAGDEARPAIDYSVTACMLSDVGCVRQINQDAVVFRSPIDASERARRGVLAVVADGMGGHRGGEVASAMAVDHLCRQYFASEAKDPLRALELAFAAANEAVLNAGSSDPALHGMGTTATALALVAGRALIGHVGDTRAYRCAGGVAEQLTEDDTLVHRMVKEGLISAQNARQHPDRGVLVNSLGTRPNLQAAMRAVGPLSVGDCFVLCSDGLHDSVTAEEIAEAVATLELEAACRHLIALARARDGTDNISVGAIAVGPPQGDAAAEEVSRAVPITREIPVAPPGET